MERIIGLDFGHCEIAAATPVYEGGKFVRIDNLYLDGEKNFVIPAEVEYCGELFNYFKASPEHFDEVVQGNGTAVRRRDLMSAALAKEGIPWVMKNPLLLIDNSRVKAAISLGMAFYEPEATKGYFDYLVARYDGKLTGQLDAEQLEMEVDFL